MDITAAIIRVLKIVYGALSLPSTIANNIFQFMVLAVFFSSVAGFAYMCLNAVEYVGFDALGVGVQFSDYGLLSSSLYFCGVDIIVEETITILGYFLGVFAAVILCFALKCGWMVTTRAHQTVKECVSQASGGAVC